MSDEHQGAQPPDLYVQGMVYEAVQYAECSNPWVPVDHIDIGDRFMLVGEPPTWGHNPGSWPLLTVVRVTHVHECPWPIPNCLVKYAEDQSIPPTNVPA